MFQNGLKISKMYCPNFSLLDCTGLSFTLLAEKEIDLIMFLACNVDNKKGETHFIERVTKDVTFVRNTHKLDT